MTREAFARAGRILAAADDHGVLLWEANGFRAYERRNGADCELTIVGGGRPPLVHVVAGVDLAGLR